MDAHPPTPSLLLQIPLLRIRPRRTPTDLLSPRPDLHDDVHHILAVPHGRLLPRELPPRPPLEPSEAGKPVCAQVARGLDDDRAQLSVHDQAACVTDRRVDEDSGSLHGGFLL
ncbi:hypothetical protein PHLCEN_2v2096 [Hermanssonia centrifuga]|uniref:Uncharacterized protein n=1 Tax=Hermanssonia centrifuga TaxID=98765 RepID=A0A2R6RQ27_9APHY|nr:hypothetical protein PHLCEN_2v2096 [Hermanssonia centrifuga]